MPETGSSLVVVTNNAHETASLGQAFARELKAGDVVALFGELGSGKTTFVQGVGAGLGSKSEITSPTFTLINEYDGRLPVYHFDFYRIENSAAAREIGSEEYFEGDGVCLIEWSEHVPELLPESRIEVHFRACVSDENPDARAITIRRQ